MNFYETGVRGYVQVLIDALGQPETLVGLMMLFAMLVIALIHRSFKWFLVGLMLFIATMDNPIRMSWNWKVLGSLAFPLNYLAQYGRVLSMAFMFILLIVAMRSQRGWRPKIVPGWAIALLVVQVFFCIRLLATDDPTKGVLGIITFVMLFLTLGIGMSKWMQDISDARTCIRAYVLASLLFVLASTYQWIMDPAMAMLGTRFMGTTSNPQAAAMFIALMLPPLLYIVMAPGERLPLKAVSWLMLAILLAFLTWTGSRGGALMAIVEVLAIFRLKLGRIVFVSLILASGLLVAMQLFPESQVGTERLFGGIDTRSHVWEGLWQDFMSNPFFGVSQSASAGATGENSYLRILARTGIFGLVSITAVMYLLFKGLWNLQRVRRVLGPDALLADVVTSVVLGLLVASVFEGILYGLVTVTIFSLYIFLGIMGFLLDYAGHGAWQTWTVPEGSMPALGQA